MKRRKQERRSVRGGGGGERKRNGDITGSGVEETIPWMMGSPVDADNFWHPERLSSTEAILVDFVFLLFFLLLFVRQAAAGWGRRCGDIMSIAGQGERKRDREAEREGGREEEGAQGGETGSRLPPGQLRMLVVSRNRINHRVERWSSSGSQSAQSAPHSAAAVLTVGAFCLSGPACPRLFVSLMLSPFFLYFLMQGRGGGEPKCAPDIGKPILLADAVVIIDYYLDNAASAQKHRSWPNEAWL